ncbi:MAG: hypothetical protein R3F59_27380 [Myxococcota bacterium]
MVLAADADGVRGRCRRRAVVLRGRAPLGGEGESDAFVARIDPQGGPGPVATFGTVGDDAVRAIVALPGGDVAVAGEVASDVRLPGDVPLAVAGDAAFVARFGPDGAARWATVVVDTLGAEVTGLVYDPSEDALVVQGQVFGFGDTAFGPGSAAEAHVDLSGTLSYVARVGSDGAFRELALTAEASAREVMWRGLTAGAVAGVWGAGGPRRRGAGGRPGDLVRRPAGARGRRVDPHPDRVRRRARPRAAAVGRARAGGHVLRRRGARGRRGGGRPRPPGVGARRLRTRRHAALQHGRRVRRRRRVRPRVQDDGTVEGRRRVPPGRALRRRRRRRSAHADGLDGFRAVVALDPLPGI